MSFLILRQLFVCTCVLSATVILTDASSTWLKDSRTGCQYHMLVDPLIAEISVKKRLVRPLRTLFACSARTSLTATQSGLLLSTIDVKETSNDQRTADWKLDSSCSMPTLVLESSWEGTHESSCRGSHRRRSIQHQLRLEIEHGTVDGLHHEKK